ncbi:TPA: hypothetical protein VVJ00_000044 [Streptococcus pneumoniae]|nr:hypothetical protein [Streptococcus pneumoniae]
MEISLLTDVGQKRTNNQDYVNHYVNRAGRTRKELTHGNFIINRCWSETNK